MNKVLTTITVIVGMLVFLILGFVLFSKRIFRDEIHPQENFSVTTGL